jgi:dihydrofolate reductase
MASLRLPRIEGYAIVSVDGMIANAARVVPPELLIDADQTFFHSGVARASAVVHGRHSHEQQPASAHHPRLITTHRVAAITPDPANDHALLWNPSGASFEDAWNALRVDDGTLAVIGGTDVFGLFLPRYDVFHLSRATRARLPGGVPVFPQVPGLSPEDILAGHGLVADAPRVLDAAAGATLTSWRRPQAR